MWVSVEQCLISLKENDSHCREISQIKWSVHPNYKSKYFYFFILLVVCRLLKDVLLICTLYEEKKYNPKRSINWGFGGLIICGHAGCFEKSVQGFYEVTFIMARLLNYHHHFQSPRWLSFIALFVLCNALSRFPEILCSLRLRTVADSDILKS